VLTKAELLLPLIGGLYVVEAMSVMIQVASFKLTGRRVFRMAPLHHHYELSGWPEPKIVVRFWIVSFALALLALTTLKDYDNYTFTHMVNVSILTMGQARALGIDGSLLREFGLAALMHDIGKVRTPLEVLNKPDKLTDDEFTIMKRHVVDGAHILRRTPEMPALAPIVAFEHHLKQDLSGYPENIGYRKLNVCTMIVSIADVFDALRSNRPYREGLATARIKSIMGEQGNPAFNQVLLRRFVNIMGLFPIGTIVRLNTDEVGVVMVLHDVTELRRLEQVRTEFVANVSHELRTPLTAIQGYLETLLSGALEERENARRFLEIVLRHSERLGRLLNDLTDLSNIELGKVTLRRGDTIAIPPTVPHSFRVVGDEVLRLLGTHVSPKRIVDYKDGVKSDARGYRVLQP